MSSARSDLRRFVLFAAMLALISAILAVPISAANRSVTGSLTYREKIALTQKAVAVVTIVDGSTTWQNAVGEPVITGGPSKGVDIVLAALPSPAAIVAGTILPPAWTKLIAATADADLDAAAPADPDIATATDPSVDATAPPDVATPPDVTATDPALTPEPPGPPPDESRPS